MKNIGTGKKTATFLHMLAYLKYRNLHIKAGGQEYFELPSKRNKNNQPKRTPHVHSILDTMVDDKGMNMKIHGI